MRATAILAAFVLSLALSQRPAVGAEVELELVLAIDVSASVNDEEYALQRSGTAIAFRDREVQEVVAAAPGGIAVVIFHWASERYQVVAIPWTRLRSKSSLDAFADEVERMPRKLPGAFVETAADFKDFARAMQRKLLREVGDPAISRLPPPGSGNRQDARLR